MKIAKTLLAGASLMVLPSLSWAQGSMAAGAAETAYNEGRRLFEANQIAAACTKFQQSWDADPQRNTLQALAVCREKEEKWASAWQDYLELARRFAADKEEDKARLARQKAGDLEKKLLYVVVVMHDRPANLAVTIDNNQLDTALLGTRLPVDPGVHDLVVTAPGKKAWKQRITVGPSPAEQQVTVPPLEDDPSASKTATGDYAMPGPAVRQPGWWTKQRIVGAAVGGAGVAALGTAAAFQLVALSQQNKRDDLKPALAANPGDTALRDSYDSYDSAAKNDQLIAIVCASAGGAMVLTGVVLIATGGHHGTTTARREGPQVTPWIGPRALGLVGTF